MTASRRCPRCERALQLSSFTLAGGGIQGYCEPCRSAYSRAWYERNGERKRADMARRRRALGILTIAERKAACAARDARHCRACGDRITEALVRYCRRPCAPLSERRSGRLKAPTRSLTCARDGCEVAFTTRKPNRRWCSKRCQQLAAAPDRSGRGRGRRFPLVRYRARAAIFERDGWICQLCGAPIDPEFRFPHPGFGTIDHRDPDGAPDPTNWQAAHLACNVSKGRKIAPGASPRLRRVA